MTDAGPLVWQADSQPHQPPKQRLLNILDQLEARVEKLRNDAFRIEQEKDNVLATLDAIKDSEWTLELDEFDREDIRHSIERMFTRCLTVETTVRTNRDVQQEESLNMVNQYIDSLVIELKNDPVTARVRCQTFMNACSFQSAKDYSEVSIDRNFECAILGCALDDQKKVKKRLQGLLDYFARMNIIES